MAEHMSPKVARAAVETNIFPLYEIINGLQYTINYVSQSLPVETYLDLQGRYSHLTREEIRLIQAETDRSWRELRKRDLEAKGEVQESAFPRKEL